MLETGAAVRTQGVAPTGSTTPAALVTRSAIGKPTEAFEVGVMKNLLAEWKYDVPAADVFQMLGYPDEESVSEPVREICRAQVNRLESLVDHWGSFRPVGILGVGRDSVQLESGGVLRSSRLAAILNASAAGSYCPIRVR